MLRRQPCSGRKKPRRQHPRIVQHEQIAGPQNLWKFAELAVGKLPGCTIQLQHPARSAHCGRLLRNQVIRQIEVEVGD